jgi:cobalt/nickel transport system permease protein
MAIIASGGGYFFHRVMTRLIKVKNSLFISLATASWLTIVAASGACAIELAISDTARMSICLPAMTLIHAVIGIGEAIITCLVISLILKVRPDLMYNSKT